jgi:hypothetical protein
MIEEIRQKEKKERTRKDHNDGECNKKMESFSHGDIGKFILFQYVDLVNVGKDGNLALPCFSSVTINVLFTTCILNW